MHWAVLERRLWEMDCLHKDQPQADASRLVRFSQADIGGGGDDGGEGRALPAPWRKLGYDEENENCAMISTIVADNRTYPARPILAVSAAIIRDGKVLIVRRARSPAVGLYTLPGGGVELGETLLDAVVREVREETALVVEPVALVGYRDAIARDDEGRIERHFVILPFAARWIAGEPVLSDELSEAVWLDPAAIAGLDTTVGLAEIIANALVASER
jgi:8-oxo-dGTP diphosphatase